MFVLSISLFSPYFSFFFFKIPKDEVCFYISFISYFLFSFVKKSSRLYMFIPMYFFGSLVYIFQTCILMCIMCLIQLLNNYEYHYVTNVIQLQLYHYQLYIHQHAIKVVTTTIYWWTHGMLANENRFR
jgi:hypothetical protein